MRSLLTRGARDERGVVIPSRLMLVAIVVVAAAAAMYVATAPGRTPARDVASSTTSAAASPSSSSSTSSSPTASGSSSATPRATRSPAATTSATASSSPSVSAPASQSVRRATTFVEVFNNTKRKGLATRTARRAEGVGWKVVGSDNWYGTIPSSTVYYPRKYARAAKALARDLGISRVEPAVTPMRNDRLTVILTSDYRAR